MAIRHANARWEGSLQEGNGRTSGQSGAFDVPFSFKTRFGEEPGTNPEELIGAAHAGCYSMALSADLGRAGFTPDYVNTTAKVHFGRVDEKPTIYKIELVVEASVPGIEEGQFQEIAAGTKNNCPVSRALGAVSEITVDATLV
jgi:osmotically inducible protein OsmC